MKRKAGEGDASAMYELGNLYSDYLYTMCEAFKLYKKAAELGNESAKQRMYDFFHEFELCSFCMGKDDELFKSYRDAAELGNSDAMMALGYIYMYRDDVERDTTESLKWFRKAIELGNTEAMVKLGEIYDYGFLLKGDSLEAIRLYFQAAECGNADAQYRLGIITWKDT